MNSFKRGNEPKEILGLGIQTYKIYRMWIFRPEIPDGMGFYIMDAISAVKALKDVSSGKISSKKYIIEFSHYYEDLKIYHHYGDHKGPREVILSDMPTCFISYNGKSYFMDRKILKKES